MNIRRLDSSSASFQQEFNQIKDSKKLLASAEVVNSVADIIGQLRTDGEQALIQLSKKYDKVSCDSLQELTFGREDFTKAYQNLDPKISGYLQQMKDYILDYHSRQIEKSWFDYDSRAGIYGQKFVPIATAGVYAPGGQAAYPSSVLMGCLPATLAGVETIIVVSPMMSGDIDDVAQSIILAAAHLSDVELLFSVGGAQAIAALALGNAGIPKVDKIVGPGNAYVTEAKRQLFGEVGIDSLAGPSELAIVADASAPVDWLVADMFAQAEHSSDTNIILFSADDEVLDKVAATILTQLPSQARSDIIAAALKNSAALIKAKDTKEAILLADSLAPEHLQLMTAEAEQYQDLIKLAASVFLGIYSSAVYGDYGAGPNHILPTGDSARFSSPLGVYDFTKRVSFLGLNKTTAAKITPATAEIAKIEGLMAHSAAAQLRVNQGGDSDHVACKTDIN